MSYIGDSVDFRVVWKKKSYNVKFLLDEKAIKLKEHIESLTGTVQYLQGCTAGQNH